jgi:GNAT superfamily N-acetyltransferase
LSAAVEIRAATPADVPRIHALIIELAEYERAREKVVGTEEMLARALFGPAPVAEALMATIADDVVGFALFYTTFSTWECRPGIWLEDLYVPPERRRDGVGGALLARVAEIAVERECGRLEWAALDWNTPALDFYAKLGAARLSDWLMHRLDGATLRGVAGGVERSG